MNQRDCMITRMILELNYGMEEPEWGLHTFSNKLREISTRQVSPALNQETTTSTQDKTWSTNVAIRVGLSNVIAFP